MLFVIHRRYAELKFQDGQDRIVHLVSRIGVAIQNSNSRPWAFADGNAGARYARFSNDLARFDELVDWNAVQATDWRDSTVKERKQAEFLVHERFPWTCFHAIGVIDQSVAEAVQRLLAKQDPCPKVTVQRDWYY